MLNFKDFQSSKRKVADVCKDLGIDLGTSDPHPGLIYEDSCYIEEPREGGYYLLIERSDWIDADLAKLERILWAGHYLDNADPPEIALTGEDLEAYIAGRCDLADVDADHAFLAKLGNPLVGASFTLAAARALLDQYVLAKIAMRALDAHYGINEKNRPEAFPLAFKIAADLDLNPTGVARIVANTL